MYSLEIQRTFEDNNYHLNSYDQLQKIMDESPQIVRVRFDMFGERHSKYFVKTDDGCEWYVWIKNYEYRD